MATITKVTKDLHDDVNANYKILPSSSETPSFHQLAELARSHETIDAKPTTVQTFNDTCLQKDAFRQPQNRSERFLSYEDSNDDDDDDVNKSIDALRMLKNESDDEDEDEEQPKIEGTVCTDMKPSLFNFKGFLDTLSLDLHLKYSMDNPRRGIALIFNNDVFDTHLGLSRRSGSGADVKQLKKQFGKLGFEVYVYANLGLNELKKR
ncbi:uncharacterized protein [Amphiura filiformis]|uniref:uncharacterized protein n=1 Tax=Amphiura filiformis TaxID=82378 RepID=UPI003B219EE3